MGKVLRYIAIGFGVMGGMLFLGSLTAVTTEPETADLMIVMAAVCIALAVLAAFYAQGEPISHPDRTDTLYVVVCDGEPRLIKESEARPLAEADEVVYGCTPDYRLQKDGTWVRIYEPESVSTSVIKPEAKTT